MATHLTLTATEGNLKGETFEFDGAAVFVVGRSRDCTVKVPEKELTVSRHHCLFTIEGDDVVVYDLGSQNGTFVNGEEILGRRGGARPRPIDAVRHLLHDGDEVQVGTTSFRVGIDVGANDTVHLGKTRLPALCV